MRGAWFFLEVDAPVAGRARWAVGVGIWAFFWAARGETGQYQGVANKALRLVPKMLVSKGLGGRNGVKMGVQPF